MLKYFNVIAVRQVDQNDSSRVGDEFRVVESEREEGRQQRAIGDKFLFHVAVERQVGEPVDPEATGACRLRQI